MIFLGLLHTSLLYSTVLYTVVDESSILSLSLSRSAKVIYFTLLYLLSRSVSIFPSLRKAWCPIGIHTHVDR